MVTTSNAPVPQGPYVQAVWAQGLLFVSGQLPLDPKTAQIKGQTMEEQAIAAIENLAAIIEAAGLTLKDTVRVRAYIADINEAASFNEVYARFFEQGTAPARELIGNVGIPKGAKLEISAVCSKTGLEKG